MPRKHVELGLEKKIELINSSKLPGETCRTLATKYGVSVGTVCGILKKSDVYVEMWEEQGGSRRRLMSRPTENEEVNQATYRGEHKCPDVVNKVTFSTFAGTRANTQLSLDTQCVGNWTTYPMSLCSVSCIVNWLHTMEVKICPFFGSC